MSVVLHLHLKAKDDQYDALHATLTAILPDTAKFKGAELISCAANPEDKSFVIHEVWADRSDQEAYFAWRAERGEIDALGKMLREPPGMEWFEHLTY